MNCTRNPWFYEIACFMHLSALHVQPHMNRHNYVQFVVGNINISRSRMAAWFDLHVCTFE